MLEWTATHAKTHRSRQAASYPDGMSRTGRFLGVPYDWRRPTVARVKERWWNPGDPRLFTPKTFGWGYDVNLARLLRRKRTP